jgi:plastocyanin
MKKMKTIILISAFIFYSGLALALSVTISYSGLTFVPDSVSIHPGDTVIFTLPSFHNALEVSQATWNANGNKPLPGGFFVPTGGGQVTGLTTGLHYYVCSIHNSF